MSVTRKIQTKPNEVLWMPKRGKTIISVDMDVGSSGKPSLTAGAEV